MKTTLDKQTRDKLIGRILTLTNENKAQWGKMNVQQMVKHCVAWEEMIESRQKLKQTFMGRLFGKIALKSMIGDEKPVKHNMPTLPELKITAEAGELETDKQQWIALIEQNATAPNTGFVHPFFGKMSVKEVGLLSYKHIDHHLRQFNC